PLRPPSLPTRRSSDLGQRLGSIAKRYNVTIDELCRANGISRKDPIFPGQKLIIPEPGKPIAPPSASQKSTTQKSSGNDSSSKGADRKSTRLNSSHVKS